MNADYDFEKVFNIEFLEGHSFQPGSSIDSAGFIINESAARAFGWEGEIIGREIDQINGNNIRTGQVIGLLKDFNYRPLYDPIKPLVITRGGGKMMIKFTSDDLRGTVAKLNTIWKEQFGSYPFRYSFMDDNFDALYDKESKFSTTIQYFSILAVFIACLGLLGLISFTTEQRTKEVGIRKVNGASVGAIIRLISKEFIILISIATIIAMPLSYYFVDNWLQSFAYKLVLARQIDVFVFGAIFAFIITILTVAYHTSRAATANPVNALREE
jgi:putative ABC transport system permease protein